MSTFILSIHVQCPQNGYWRKFQPIFVADTQGTFEYGTIANGEIEKCPNEVLRLPKKTTHRQAITHALKLFAKSKAKYFLLLDSDCWPIRPDWQQVINDQLSDRYLYAAPMRVENFDIFPHPCAFYMKREFLEFANFDFRRMTNLLGYEVADVGMAMPQMAGSQQIWYPLLKSNYISPHPLFASIYGDVFYHHCAGSRGATFRAAQYGSYDHMIGKGEHVKIYRRLTSELARQPRKFIEKLRGVGVERGTI